MSNIFLKAERFYLRYITQNDFKELQAILQNKEVMYAWEYDFSNEDVQDWINNNLERYKKYNLGFFIIIEKTSGKVLGQAALMPDLVNGNKYYEIGYILKKEYWHQGFATEAAKALVHYAFNTLRLEEVIFEIRPENFASRKVAENLNAKICGDPSSFLTEDNGFVCKALVFPAAFTQTEVLCAKFNPSFANPINIPNSPIFYKVFLYLKIA